ncbi:class I SAM-dependent methyltransferase [Pseudobacteriovorax antillogorgiicola]|uniref:Methyltransferase domain-containing protein n=1 Tax=Pseudobacteriovorax antillogorgiicola TaxID=1513793 RepID=A0A1Y6BZL8_9BACT|nr:class I SAM-dependent methyltransferase [Pseudobacteriovorax antillogorgiicola]TCS51179.1 methyltransferase family protein [Pseudobacteriovorax antillogorgiicola]SMF37914.1 Methyltransferase domain-containing protein [Pseudobacteriovorax antillogorgiicola]
MSITIPEYYDLVSELYSQNECASVNFIGQFIDDFLADLPEGASIADLGCGPGDEAEKHGDRLYFSGVDVSRKVLESYQKRVNASKTFHNSINSLPFDDNSFDALMFLFSILHIDHENGKKAISEAYRVLKPNSKMMFATAIGEANTVIHAIHPEFMKIDHLKPIPFYLWNPDDLRAELLAVGFEIESDDVGPIAEGRGSIIKLTAKKKLAM